MIDAAAVGVKRFKGDDQKAVRRTQSLKEGSISSEDTKLGKNHIIGKKRPGRTMRRSKKLPNTNLASRRPTAISTQENPSSSSSTLEVSVSFQRDLGSTISAAHASPSSPSLALPSDSMRVDASVTNLALLSIPSFRQPQTTSSQSGLGLYPPSILQKHPLVGTEASTSQTVSSSSPRRGWLQDQQQQQFQQQQVQQAEESSQPLDQQHISPQQQRNIVAGRAHSNYPPLSPLNLQLPINSSDHRPLSSFAATSSFVTGQSGNSNPNEGGPSLGMPSFPSQQPQEQFGYDGHQNYPSTGINALSQYSVPRPFNGSGDHSEMSSMSGSASDWTSLPNLRLVSVIGRSGRNLIGKLLTITLTLSSLPLAVERYAGRIDVIGSFVSSFLTRAI